MLVDYNKSHVVTIIEYLEIMRQKVTKKEVTKQIKEAKRKEREERKDRQAIELLNVAKQAIKKHV